MLSFFTKTLKKQNFLQKHRDELQKAATGQEAILSEIKNERTKREHWMWWAFPINLKSYVKDNSLHNIEFSNNAKTFALTPEEAKEYIQDRDLRAQLIKRLLAIAGKKNLGAFFSKVDIDKLNSSVKLFLAVTDEKKDQELIALLLRVSANIFNNNINDVRKHLVRQRKMNSDITSAIIKGKGKGTDTDDDEVEADDDDEVEADDDEKVKAELEAELEELIHNSSASETNNASSNTEEEILKTLQQNQSIQENPFKLEETLRHQAFPIIGEEALDTTEIRDDMSDGGLTPFVLEPKNAIEYLNNEELREAFLKRVESLQTLIQDKDFEFKNVSKDRWMPILKSLYTFKEVAMQNSNKYNDFNLLNSTINLFPELTQQESQAMQAEAVAPISLAFNTIKNKCISVTNSMFDSQNLTRKKTEKKVNFDLTVNMKPSDEEEGPISDADSMIWTKKTGTNHAARNSSNKKFDRIFDEIKKMPKIKDLTTEQVIGIFTNANKKDGYTNKITEDFKPSSAEKEFSVEFQKLCFKNGIASPNNNQVGLRTKRFVDEFESQEKMREYIESKWNNKQEVQKS